MKKKVVFSVMLVCMLALSLAFVGCDNGSTGGGGDTYSLHGSGLDSTEWNNYFSSMNPSDLINQVYDATTVNSFFQSLAADSNGVHNYGQSEAQIRTTLAGYYGDSTVNTIISKLQSQGWVFYGTQPPQDNNDYADIVGIIKE